MERSKELLGLAALIHKSARYVCRICGHSLNKRNVGGFRKKLFALGYVEFQPVCRSCSKSLDDDEKI